jgi:hypothetical protein
VKVSIEGEWDVPEPDWAKVSRALMELGVYDLDIVSDKDD